MSYKNKLLSVLLCIFSASASLAGEMPVLPPGYAVASAHSLATNAGIEILAQGGNAFDAAIAVAAALAVVEPFDSGLGGGGFWLLHQAKKNRNTVIDSREVAPLAAHKDMFLDKHGEVIPGLSTNGGLAAAIPGEPAAFAYIAQHYGRLSLKQSLAPAIKLAREGFLVDYRLKQYSQRPDRLMFLREYASTAALFLNNNEPYAIGERLIQTDLANTLTALAEHGHKGFYEGKIAQQLVDGVNKAGGIWSLADLAAYQVKEREPLIGAFHNMLVVTIPPPSAGGVALLTMMNILSYHPLTTYTQPQWIHYVVEAMRLAYWQRDQFLADPDFVKIPLERLISAENAKQLNSLIPANKAIDSSILAAAPVHNEQEHTTHLSIIDAEGNRVAATLSLNYFFGSSVVAEGTGVLLNDGMDDFATKAGAPNVFGLVGSDINTIAPGKRPLSSMTPAFLETPGRLAIVGTPGGSRIPTMVLLASLIFNDGYGAISMTSGMRFHHQYLPDVIEFEPNTFTESVQTALKSMGYQLKPLEVYYGNMQAITWNKAQNLLTSTADPRSNGLAVVILNDGKKVKP